MRMLESKLILNVTVCAPEPDDHLAHGETVKDRVVGPEPPTLLPGGAQVQALLTIRWCKHDFRFVSHFDEGGIGVLHDIGHNSRPYVLEVKAYGQRAA